MIDFYYQLRQRMVDAMQASLKQIRQVLGFGVQEFGDLIGLTRQTINNLETQKNKMSSIQYIAVCAGGKTKVLEFHFTGNRKEVREQACNAALQMVRTYLMEKK